MKLSSIFPLSALPFLVACTNQGVHSLAAHASPKALPTAVQTTQPGTQAEWMNALVSAKASGALYRAGAFFPHAPAADGVAFP